MKFTPKYTVSYRGSFHPPGKSFEIDKADVEEMRKHGTVEVSEPAPIRVVALEVAGQSVEEIEGPVKQPSKKGGRPRKAVSA